MAQTMAVTAQAAIRASMPVINVPSSHHATKPTIPESPNMRLTVRIERDMVPALDLDS